MEEQRFKKQQEIIKTRAAKLEVINNIIHVKNNFIRKKKEMLI